MAHLALSLLGFFQVQLEDQLIAGLSSSKAGALLAYLAVETEHSHSRHLLADLLWPERSEIKALDSLRFALSYLRRQIEAEATTGNHHPEESFLLITRDTLQLNPQADCWRDIHTFIRATEADQWHIEQLKHAVDLYRGAFLEGFLAHDSEPFEDWLRIKRLFFEQRFITTLDRLASYYKERRQFTQALKYARRWAAADSWNEQAHREVMRLFVLENQRGAALAQYNTCRRILSEDLGIKPVDETTRLYEQIKAGLSLENMRREMITVPLPRQGTIPPFVARKNELARLYSYLDLVLDGQGQIVFVTGDPGSGKTMLVNEFARQALAVDPRLLVAQGYCTAQLEGSPFLPLQNILSVLTGDYSTHRESRISDDEHIQRLWAALPVTVRALVEVAPDLVGLLLSGDALLRRIEGLSHSGSKWLKQLEKLANQDANQTLTQVMLLNQVVRFFQAVAAFHPLILIWDDLQWADHNTLELLFHLGNYLHDSRLLILGIYRLNDVNLGRRGDRHPIEPIVNELQAKLGSIVIDLAQANGRVFTNAYLDSEPNQFDQDFREAFYQHTAGNPLFVVNMLKSLQARGDLVQNDRGGWIISSPPDWGSLPARVEGAIAERIGRLDPDCQSLLAAASVEGFYFSSEIIACIQPLARGEITRHLSILSDQHRLIQLDNVDRIGLASNHLTRYRFHHGLIQQYLYNRLDSAEKITLHHRIGESLETIYNEYGANLDPISSQLAHHFEIAGLPYKAIPYLLKSGQQALRLLAYMEAEDFFQRSLTLARTLPQTPERVQLELRAISSLAEVFVFSKGLHSKERFQIIEQALQIIPAAGPDLDVTGAFSILNHQLTLLRAGGQGLQDHAVVEQLLNWVEHSSDPMVQSTANRILGEGSFYSGEFSQARIYLERGLDGDTSGDTSKSNLFTFQDAQVYQLCMLSLVLWALGYPDQALRRVQQALRRAQEMNQRFSQSQALAYLGIVHILRGDNNGLATQLAPLLQSPDKLGTNLFKYYGEIFIGLSHVQQGQVTEGIAKMQAGIESLRSSGTQLGLPLSFLYLAQAYDLCGEVQPGLRAVESGLDLVENSRIHFPEAGLWSVKGNLLAKQTNHPTDTASPEACFLQAIKLAQRQNARMWELKARVGLARWRSQCGQRVDVQALLSEIVSWFTEGLDLPDLCAAKQLLNTLS